MAGYFEFRCADGDRLAAHLLQKCDDGQNFIFEEPDRILIDRTASSPDIPSAPLHVDNRGTR